MSSKDKALDKKSGRVENMVIKKFKDSKGVKAKKPYKFINESGAKNDK